MYFMATLQNSAKYYWHASIICSLPILFYLYEFAIRTIPSAMTHELMENFNITAAGLGILTSLFYYGYSAMQIPVGLLYDRFGARLLLTTATGLCALATFLFGLSPNIWVAGAAFFLIGFVSSFAFIGALVLVSNWFPRKYFAMIAGMVNFLGCVGGIVGQKPVAVLVQKIGWHQTIYCVAALGVILFILMLLLLRNRPSGQAPSHVYSSTRAQIGEIQRLKIVCHNPQTWWIALYSFAAWAPVIVFAGLWGIPFLETFYHISISMAASALIFFWLGVAMGSPIIGWWSNHINSRRIPAVFCGLLSLLTSIAIIYSGALSWLYLNILLFLFGAGSSGQALSFAIVQDNHPPIVAGTAISINNMASIVGGIFLQPVVGFILKYSSGTNILEGRSFYSAPDYQIALAIIPSAALMGIVTALFFIKETHCKAQYPLDEIL